MYSVLKAAFEKFIMFLINFVINVQLNYIQNFKKTFHSILFLLFKAELF